MFVTDIRYGESPVKKVYLGEKLVWRRVGVTGDAESTSQANAFFYLQNPGLIAGDAQSTSCNNSDAKSLKLSLMMSEDEILSFAESKTNLVQVLNLKTSIEHTICTDSAAILYEVLLVGGSAQSNSSDKTIGCALNTKEMKELSSILSNDKVLGRLLIVKNVESEVEIKHTTSAVAGAYEQKPANGNIVISSDIKAVGLVADLISMNTNVKSQFVATAVGGSYFPVTANSIAKSTSSGDSLIYVLDVLSTGGTSSSTSVSQAIGTLFDALLAEGDAKAIFDNNAVTSRQWAIPSQGHIKHTTTGDSLIGWFFSILSGGDARSDFICANSSIALWYVPIGDGIPLGENDGINITANGNTLEIQQAYKIKIDNEKGILEVI